MDRRRLASWTCGISGLYIASIQQPPSLTDNPMLALSDTVGQDFEAATPDGEWWQEVDTFSKR
jgi:hypothetical protein